MNSELLFPTGESSAFALGGTDRRRQRTQMKGGCTFVTKMHAGLPFFRGTLFVVLWKAKRKTPTLPGLPTKKKRRASPRFVVLRILSLHFPLHSLTFPPPVGGGARSSAVAASAGPTAAPTPMRVEFRSQANCPSASQDRPSFLT